jgi:hypothetical protein
MSLITVQNNQFPTPSSLAHMQHYRHTTSSRTTIQRLHVLTSAGVSVNFNKKTYLSAITLVYSCYFGCGDGSLISPLPKEHYGTITIKECIGIYPLHLLCFMGMLKNLYLGLVLLAFVLKPR